MEASQAERRSFIDFSQIHSSELIGFASAGVLFLSLYLPWFSTSETNRNSQIHGDRGDFNAWETFGTLDWLLVAACSAPFVLAYIIARGHALTWRPGEVTMIVGITAFALILMNGIILGRPGDSVDISLKYGYLVGLLGAAGIAIGGFIRQAQLIKGRRPPGVLS